MSDSAKSAAADPPPPPQSRGPRRAWLFRLASAGMAFGFALVALGGVEAFLRKREASIRQSDRLDAGLIRHDPLLGWALAPRSEGRHAHHDYQALYHIDETGFRAGGWSPAAARAGKLHAFVGDSFTFGLGVNDSQTFTSLLNHQRATNAAFINCGIPGFSTDQEALMIERDVLPLKPDQVWVVVCLVNDLVDNLHPYPMQANRQKPHFELVGEELLLRNTPVPIDPVDPRARRSDLLGEILGADFSRQSWRRIAEGRYVIFRALSENLLPPPDVSGALDNRNRKSLDLFFALMARSIRAVESQGARFGLILMPGRSLIEKPASISGQYQRYLEANLLTWAKARRLPAINLVAALSNARGAGASPLFFPHDGHLTPLGHEEVARALAAEIP